ncbi:hypothetical protein EON64_21315, partial [archaeon]
MALYRLEAVDAPAVKLAENEVAVKILVAPINPADLNLVCHPSYTQPNPYICISPSLCLCTGRG